MVEPLKFEYDHAVSRLISESTGKRPWYSITKEGDKFILTVDNLVHHEHTRTVHETLKNAIGFAQDAELQRINEIGRAHV